MYNQLFHMISLEEKQNKLRRIIKSKVPFISDIHLNQIMQYIDFDKQYTIKVISNIEKFKNIVVKERVETDSQMFSSVSIPIYGEFSPGLGILMYLNGKGCSVKKSSIKFIFF